MALNLKPISGTSNRVIVEPAAAEEKTASGIYIPDTAKEKPSVKVGDVVLYGKYGGTELPIDGKDYLIMRENDIYAIVL
ncbi:MAG: co-chaperone GroES [Pedobacter sp.]|nr:MAG: co-chaperone GroES [Pedobacter sp.]